MDEANMTEEEKKKYNEAKERQITNQINKFWEKNSPLLESEENNEQVKEENKNKKKKKK